MKNKASRSTKASHPTRSRAPGPAGGIFKNAAIEVLRRERRLMTTGEICRLALDSGLLQCSGKTPEATMASSLYGDIKRKDSLSTFIRPREGMFGLREWLAEGSILEPNSTDAEQSVSKRPLPNSNKRGIRNKKIKLHPDSIQIANTDTMHTQLATNPDDVYKPAATDAAQRTRLDNTSLTILQDVSAHLQPTTSCSGDDEDKLNSNTTTVPVNGTSGDHRHTHHLAIPQHSLATDELPSLQQQQPKEHTVPQDAPDRVVHHHYQSHHHQPATSAGTHANPVQVSIELHEFNIVRSYKHAQLEWELARIASSPRLIQGCIDGIYAQIAALEAKVQQVDNLFGALHVATGKANLLLYHACRQPDLAEMYAWKAKQALSRAVLVLDYNKRVTGEDRTRYLELLSSFQTDAKEGV